MPKGIHTPSDHGYLHSVETGAAVDGPGMRFVFFMSGCQFRCLYCHNPDTWKLHNGRKVNVEEMLDEVRPYKGFLKVAGGVTFSGGEPMMQANFVGEVIRRIKDEMGLHIALDTQGFLHNAVSDEWLNDIDLFLLDIKEFDPEKYKKLTAQPLQPTLDFAHRLKDLGKHIWLRYVLVPGYTDAREDIEGLADFLLELGPEMVERVEVLPFHQLGSHKWEELKMPYELKDTPTPTQEEAETARQIFRDRGLLTY